MRTAGLILLFLASFFIAPKTHAAGVILGPFCIEGVALVENTTEKTITTDGYWVPAKFHYKKPKRGAGKARMSLFDRPLPKFVGLPTCKEVQAEAAKGGINLIFSGSIDKLDLAAQHFVADSGNNNRLQIPEGSFHAQLGSIDAGTQRLDGGTIHLKGGKLSITNPTKFLGTATALAGVFQINLPDRKIANMRLAVAGGTELRVNFAQVNPRAAPLAIRIDMGTREADLWSGHLRGSPAALVTGPSMTIGDVTLVSSSVSVRNVELIATGGKVATKFNTVQGKANDVFWKRHSIALHLNQPSFTWKLASGTGKSGPGQFNIALTTIAGADFKSSMVSLSPDGQADLLTGPAQVTFSTISAARLDGTLKWESGAAPALQFFIPPNALRVATLAIHGSPEAPKINGTFDLKEVALSGMTLNQPLTLGFQAPNLSRELRLPVKFDVRDKSGAFTLSDRDQKALITAGLRRAYLDATLVIDFSDLKESRLEVPKEQFELTLFSTVATQPFLAGTVPAFGEVDVSAKNPVPLRVGMTGSGHVNIVTGLLVLGEPIVRIGKKGSESRAGLKLQAQGDATFAYDFATGIFGLSKASFEAKDVDFRLLDKGGKIDLSGILVTDPELKMKQLRINYNQETPIKVGTAEFLDFSFNGSQVEKPRDAEKPNEVVFQGAISNPLSVKELAALSVKIDKVLALELITIKQFEFAMTGVRAEFGDSFRVKNASLRLSADALATIKINDDQLERFDNARFAANGQFDPGNTFSVNNSPTFQISLNVSGYSNKLNGAGAVAIGAFTGSKQAEAEIDFPCADGKKPKVPLEYNFAFSGLSTNMTMNEGAVQAEASIGPLVLLLHTKSGVQCDGKQHEKTIDIPVPPYPCGSLLKPKICTSIEVTGKYHIRYEVLFGGGAITLTDALINFNHHPPKVCNKGAIDASKLIVVPNIYPQIDNDIPGIVDIANATLKVSFISAETILATSITSGIGLFASTLLTSVGKIGCF